MYQILVIDDFTTNGMIVKQALTPGKYEIKTVSSGTAGIDYLIAGNQVDLILLDINMPEMDGVETLIKIRQMESFKELPILFLTGQADKIRVIQGFQNGVDDVISKPIKPKIINERIERALNGESPVQIYKKNGTGKRDMSELKGIYTELLGDFMQSMNDTKREVINKQPDDIGNTQQPAELESIGTGSENFGIDMQKMMSDENLW